MTETNPYRRRVDNAAHLDYSVITGDADYLLRVLVSGLSNYNRFVREKVHEVPGVAFIDTGFAYGQIEKSNVFPSMSR